MLIQLLLMGLLFSNVLADCRFIKTYGTHTVTTSPKVKSGKIFAPTKIPAMDQYRGLAFQAPYRLRYRIPGRDAQAHVNMIRQGVPLYQFYTKLATQLTEYLAYLLPKSSKYRFLPIFGNEDDMVKTVPSDVGLLFPFSHHRLSPDCTTRWHEGLSLFFAFIQPRYGRTFYGHTAGGGGLTDL
jgi:hypothetical protein